MNKLGCQFLSELKDLLERHQIELQGNIYIYCKKDTNLQGDLEFNYETIEIVSGEDVIADSESFDKK